MKNSKTNITDLTVKYYLMQKDKINKIYAKRNNQNMKNNYKPNSFINTFYSSKNFITDKSNDFKYKLNSNYSIKHKNKTKKNYSRNTIHKLDYPKNLSYSNISNLYIKNNSAKNIINLNYKYSTPILNNNEIIRNDLFNNLKKIKQGRNKGNETRFRWSTTTSLKNNEKFKVYYPKIQKNEKKNGLQEIINKKNNKFKIDINDLIDDEVEEQHIINAKKFSNIKKNNNFSDKLKSIKRNIREINQ